MPRHIWAHDYARFGWAMDTKARFTLGVRANVQPKSSIPIGAKVEISLAALH
jgi:hypothetical protein